MRNEVGSQAIWPVLALVAGVLTWGALSVFAPLGRTWVLLAMIAVIPYVVGPFRSGDGWWPGLSALIAALWWGMLGAHRPLWQAAVVALFLGIHWLALSWSALAPRWATHAPGYLARRLVILAAFVGSCALGIGLVCLAAAVAPLPFGPAWAILGAAALLAAFVAAGLLLDRR